jgi:hypothetical protein
MVKNKNEDDGDSHFRSLSFSTFLHSIKVEKSNYLIVNNINTHEIFLIILMENNIIFVSI